MVLAIIWAVAGLNISGIRENARFTFMIFIGAAFVMLNLIASGILNLDQGSIGQMHLATTQAIKHVEHRLDSEKLRPFHFEYCLLYPGLLRGGIGPPNRRDLCAVGKKSARPTGSWP